MLLNQWFLAWIRSSPKGLVRQFQGFGSLVHPTRTTHVKFMFCWFCSLNTVIFCAYDAWCTVCAIIQYFVIYLCFEFEEIKVHFIFPTTKGSMNAWMGLVGFSHKSHCSNPLPPLDRSQISNLYLSSGLTLSQKF